VEASPPAACKSSGLEAASEVNMRKDTTRAKMETKRNKKIHHGTVLSLEPFASWLSARRAYSSERAYRARFAVMIKNIWDAICRQMALNLFRG
jgi:hypothetical protein